MGRGRDEVRRCDVVRGCDAVRGSDAGWSAPEMSVANVKLVGLD